MRAKKVGTTLVTLFALFFLLTTALATPVPDTGQTECYDNDGWINCPQPGEPFYGQDAQYMGNQQSYTKLDENGNDLPDETTEWIMVRDNVTGLIWEIKTDNDPPDIHDKDNTYDWYDAQDVFIATLNSQYFGGYSDWRLPTVKELMSLVNRNTYGPSIDTTYFPNTQLSFYWSSTTNAKSPETGWLVYFTGGHVYPYDKSYSSYSVRAVRGGQSFNNFVDNGDGTITDTNTGLMWQQSYFTDNWQRALSYCENLTLAGYGDWRLPNINELHSLVDYERYYPSIDTTYFPNTASSFYWSSTSSLVLPHTAWYVHFYLGQVSLNDKSCSLCAHSVRAVRGALMDSDDDGISDVEDNCPNIPNLDQLDTYPPQGNNCGDACDCEGDFDADGDVDGTDAFKFKQDFFVCHTNCDGDFICDGDVDGSDAFMFKKDFFRPDCPTNCDPRGSANWCGS